MQFALFFPFDFFAIKKEVLNDPDLQISGRMSDRHFLHRR